MTRRRAPSRLLAPALLAGAAAAALAGCAASPEYAIAPGGSAGPSGRAEPVRPAYPVSADDAARTAGGSAPPAVAATAPAATDDDLAPGPRVAPAPVDAQPLDAPPPASATPSAGSPPQAATPSPPAPGLAYAELQRREVERRHDELEARRRRAVAAKAKSLLPEHREPDVRRYTLARGDTLYGMGRRFGLEPRTLAKALGVKLTATLQPGETVTLPDDAEPGRHASAGARGELDVTPGRVIAPTRAERAAALAKAERAVPSVPTLEIAETTAPAVRPPRPRVDYLPPKPFDVPPLPSRAAELPATAVRSSVPPTSDRSAAAFASAPPVREVVPATPSSPRPYTSLGALGASRTGASSPPSSRSGRRTESDAQAAYQVAAARAAARAGATSPDPSSSSTGMGVESGRGRFRWPVRGEVLSGFGSKGPGQRNDGVDIAAVDGEPVRAAAAGEVVYAGHDVPALGNLVAVKHTDGWVTIYGNLQRITVRPRDKVGQGGQVGLAGTSGVAARPQVHFEVRYAPSATDKARPVDPQLVLPGGGPQAAG